MKILHIYDSDRGEKALAGESSPSTVVFYISKYSAEKGHDVTVLERKYQETDPSVEYIDGVKFVRLEAKKRADIPYKEIKKLPFGPLRLILDGITFAVKINRFLKENDFDVIHVHFPFAANILIHLNRRLRRKMVYTAHIGEERKRFALDSSAPLILKFFSPDLYLMKKVKKSIVLNKPLKNKLIEKGIKEEKLEVIPNGVNVEDFNLSEDEMERVKAKYGLNETTIMFAGNVIPRKGVEYLIRAAEILNDEKILLLIVGNTNLDREYAEKVIDYAKKKRINAKFTGFVPYEDLKALYKACDIFVLPSLEEGFGIVLTEALASGKPLIGTNIGGILAQIKDGWNGFLVEPGDEKGLAERIRYLIENEEERIRMGKNSKKLAEEFDWKKITERYLEVYEEVQNETR
jgi:glycosyltransferase involved in cell wall biosynthesis